MTVNDINPFDHTDNPNHLLYPLTKEQEKDMKELYNSIKEGMYKNNKAIPLKPLFHALIHILVDGLLGWRNMGLQTTIDKLDKFDEKNKQDIIDTLCYVQHVQIITLLLHHVPTDINKQILQTCLKSQEIREQYYFGQSGDIYL